MSNLRKELHSEAHDVKRIWYRITRRDFSGNTGQAIKNSLFQILTNITTKVGSLIFTILLARILMPELYGNYALALSTIMIFLTFSDLGIMDVIVRFVSKELGKGDRKKAGAYIKYLSKIKIALVFLVSIILVASSNLLANSYYHKPIGLALLAGGLYILIVGLIAMIQAVLRAYNLFKSMFIKETIFQILRTVSIPLILIYLLKTSLTDEKILFWIILLLALSYFISAISFLFNKNSGVGYAIKNADKLLGHEKKETNKFLFLLSVTALSGVFFGYVDAIMLGRFVSSQYIAFYSIAFNFVSAIVMIMTFSTNALLPTFSRLSKQELNSLFRRSFKTLLLISSLVMVVVFAVAPWLINWIVGTGYSPSIVILRIFCILFLFLPLIGLYSAYFTAIGKPESVTKSLIISTIINIVLNFVLITSLLKYGEIYSVYGATVATILSRVYYFISLSISRRKIRG